MNVRLVKRTISPSNPTKHYSLWLFAWQGLNTSFLGDYSKIIGLQYTCGKLYDNTCRCNLYPGES
jgi:hypothetical protein